MDATKRYAGLATVRRSYMNQFFVHCPKCRGLALIETNQSYDTSDDKLTCQSCHYIEKRSEPIRYNATVQRACDNCGKSIEKTVHNNKEKVEELTISCSNCGQVRTYKPRNDAYGLHYENSLVGDPIFNLPLWFQADIKGEIFWAYNRKHLNEIRDYVSSKLRERQTMKYTTMVERLPNFIKFAKNREVIIKVIDKLSIK
ncbi:MAG: DNA-directed RNA polymerase subunit M/transcription elongation factor TFIIS [Spirosomataceae bacterium]|jgi:DNA-directed RNA polymerase subunit M/transcription elongation factor TFIIS